MRSFTTRRRLRVAITAALLVVTSLAFSAGSASAGSQTTTNACDNSATFLYTDVPVTFAGTATQDGDTVTLSLDPPIR